MDLTSVAWRKSSYSGCNGGNCIEVADLTGANWRTSSWSGPDGGNCVQVADLPGTIAVRDSKDPDGPALLFTPAEWAAFTARVKVS
jgi:Domain of unknown function (DUF397)